MNIFKMSRETAYETRSLELVLVRTRAGLAARLVWV